MDDFLGTSVGAAGTNMVFKITGVVYDNAQNPLPNHALKASLIYWQFVGGVSTEKNDDVTFTSGISGAYVLWYKGQDNPVLLWDETKGIAVSVTNNQAGWSAVTNGQYDGKPTGNSPIPITVSDTICKQP